jgi:hypothetical protein
VTERPVLSPLSESLQSHAGSCSPEALARLQRIFDAIWLELEAKKSPHTFPWAVEAARYTIARLVLQHVNNVKDAEHIKREVLRTLTSGDTKNGKMSIQ